MPTSQHPQPGAPPEPFGGPPAATAVISADGTVIGWSPQAERLLGHPAEEVVGRPAAELVAAPDRLDAARIASILSEAAAHGSWEGLVEARRHDGGLRPLGVRVVPLCKVGGERSWLALAVDMHEPQWDVNRQMLERFLTRSPIGMAVVGTDLRYLWLNDALERSGGVPREQRLGRRLKETMPGLDVDGIEAVMRQVLETGEPVIDHHYQGFTEAAPGLRRSFSSSFFRLDDSAGYPQGVCYVVLDVTDRREAQERLALLNEASARIGSTLDVGRTAQELVDVAVPRLADFTVIDVLEPVLSGEELAPGPSSGDIPLRRAAQRSVREGCPEALVDVGEQVDYVPSSPAARCLAEGRAILQQQQDAEQDRWLTDDPARAARIHQYGAVSRMCVPMRARGITMGVATFIRQTTDRPLFDEDDLRLAEEFVGRAALCLDNARRFTREHTAALTLQRSLLPHRLVRRSAVEVASRYLPADGQAGVGGDWFDVIQLSGARVALVVGDVVGHGIDAAAAMGRLRTAVQTLADMDLAPDELLAHLDDLVIRLSEEESAAAITGASCLYAVYDPVTRRCTMARAAHPPPAVVDAEGAVTFPELPAGPPLGLGSLPFESAELELPEGSLLALYTDGLIDNRRHRDIDAGLDRLRAALSHPDRPLEQLCGLVIRSMLDGHPTDDVALLLARTRGLSADEVATWDLPVDPAVVATARELATRQLESWGLQELLFTTELVVSELVTNAIRHAAGPIQLRLIRQSVLTCEVSDASSTSPRLRHARTTDEGGRGLLLVAQLTRRWGTRYTHTGKIIWAEQSIPMDEPEGSAPALDAWAGGDG
ncbi:SpoIIE family protein phosphatase [Peterkaempfera bronchialis]|uniref:SpoIIE family protein phosphatase n=1 Tax=Peterkaempfera bronchialis TaxID=2126346 RepID=UPI003C2F3E1A